MSEADVAGLARLVEEWDPEAKGETEFFRQANKRGGIITD